MKPSLDDYREIVGDRIISEIYKKARNLYGSNVQHINSTYYGGGVAEILTSLVKKIGEDEKRIIEIADKTLYGLIFTVDFTYNI